MVYALIFLISAGGVLLNPWKAGDWSRYYSAVTTHRLIPYAFSWGRSPKTTIVIANDAFLKEMRQEGGVDNAVWPLRYGVYANILLQATDFGARAVFLDLTLADPRDDETYDALLAQLEETSRTIPIFIGAGSEESGIGQAARPEILELIRRGADITLVSATSGRRLAPDIPTYVLTDSADGFPSVAVALDRRLCLRPGCAPIRNRKEMEIVWASPPTAAQCQAFAGRDVAIGYDGCVRAAASPWARGFQILVLQPLRGPCQLLGGGDDCLIETGEVIANSHDRAMTLGDFLSGTFGARNAAAVKDSIVMVGLDFAYARDRLQSPVYGDTQGVHAHAQALANLAVFGERYFTASPADPGRKLAEDVFVLLQICMVAFGLSALVLAVQMRRPGRLRAWSIPLSLTTATFLIVILTVWSRQSPANWLGAFGATTLAAGLAKGFGARVTGWAGQE